MEAPSHSLVALRAARTVGAADDGKTFKNRRYRPPDRCRGYLWRLSPRRALSSRPRISRPRTSSFRLSPAGDVADGEKAINAFNTLCDWGMQALVGPVTTGAAVAVSGEIADDMLMVTPSASSLDVTKDKTTVFQVCFTHSAMGASAAKFSGREVCTRQDRPVLQLRRYV